MKAITALTLAAVLAPLAARADVCDFRPSILAGNAGSAVRDTAVSGVRAVGAYTLQNPLSGASMISSGVGTATAAGSSIVGSAAGIVTAPVTIAVAGATAVALGGYEGVCYFRAERITDRDEILYIVTNLAANSDPTMFAVIPEGAEYTNLKGKPAVAGEAKIRVASEGAGPWIFDVADLYISDGVLMHRETLRNRVIGNVALEVVEAGTRDD
ncbi:hypothetical protein [Citreimonas salinaria]|uniref:Uncharacterized protein n=1 Tax=Citreimonas salinaria TaxID=321339 RepID=A0A1H3MQD9_9RHOB|nr:hypothetical protein [Citreimonas salinaria]SDY78720.1 hypothetical protein SAMN05444340_11812 [Citreimonas salinaria]